MNRINVPAVLWLAGLTVAAEPIYEPFDYPATETLLGKTPVAGSTWVPAGPPGPAITVRAGGLVVADLPLPVGNLVQLEAVEGPGARLPLGEAATNHSVFFSFILEIPVVGLLDETFYSGLVGFDPAVLASTNPPAMLATRVWTRAAPSGGYNLGLSKTSTNSQDLVWAPGVYQTNENLFLVGSYEFVDDGPDVARLWVVRDTTTEDFFTNAPPPTLSATNGDDLPRIASFTVQQFAPAAAPTVARVDELRIATTWADVAPVGPPQRDFGDAPDPPYPTLLPAGARHRVSALRLGTLLDAESNGQPVDLDGADENGDGVYFAPFLTPGAASSVTIVASGPPGYIDLWIDWDGLPGWSAADRVLLAAAHPGGGASVAYPFAVPAGAPIGFTWARVRLSLNPAGLPPGGSGGLGEVADYQLQIKASVNLGVALSAAAAEEGEPMRLTAVVSNQGPGSASQVVLQAVAVLTPSGPITVLSNAPSQGSCTQSTEGLVWTVGSLPAQGSATLDVWVVPAPEMGDSEQGSLEVTAQVTSAEPDANPPDNQAAVQVPVWATRDWGDAPDHTVNPAFLFPTLMADNGPRHRRMGPYFGGSPAGAVQRDRDPDGIPTANADGDDMLDANNDEAGIVLLNPLVPGAVVSVQIDAPLGGKLDAWMDFDHSLSWAMAPSPEQIFASFVLTPGIFAYPFTVPATAVVGETYARFRISQAGGLTDRGYVTTGEVQDYKFQIVAANPNLKLNLQSGTPAAEEGEPMRLTAVVSNQGPGSASQVVLQAVAVLTPSGPITVLSNAPSQGSCTQSTEGLVWTVGSLPAQGSATLDVWVVPAPEMGDSEQGSLEVTAQVTSAEPDANPPDNQAAVQVPVWATRDWGDAPEPTYPTTFVNNGPRHRCVGPCFAGSPAGMAQRDRDPDGLPTPNADGDDVLDLNADEEGITFLDPLVPGALVQVQFRVVGGGRVDAWMDFNGGGWTTPGEQIFASVLVPAGVSVQTFTVPAWAIPGPTDARFRISEAGGLPYTGFAANGEVQDYGLMIQAAPSAVKFGKVEYTALGSATLSTTSNALVVANLGPSGVDGLEVNLAQHQGNARVSLAPLTLNAVGAQFRFKWVAGFHAGREASAGELVIERAATSLSLTGDFSPLGSAAIQIEVLRDGLLVGSFLGVSSNVTGTITAPGSANLPGLVQASVITDRPDGAILFTAQFDGTAHFAFPGLGADGNELRFVALDPRYRMDSLDRFEIRAANLAAFVVLGIATEPATLGLQLAGGFGQPVIKWSQADALLEKADVVAGPWNTVSNAATGVTVDTKDPQKFFRLAQMADRSEMARTLRRAELVFEGTVTGVEYRDSSPQDTNDVAVPHTFVTFAIQRVFKGSYSGGTITLRFAGGLGADGRLLRVKESTLFDVGERSILLARGNEQYASPLVGWAGGRFRLVGGYVYAESGHELVSTPNSQLQIGAWRDLTEVRENDIGGKLLGPIRSPYETEDGQPFEPPAAEKLTEEGFRQFLSDLIQRIHTPEELQSLPPVSSASSAQPFSVPNPGSDRGH